MSDHRDETTNHRQGTGTQSGEAWTVLRLLEWTTDFFRKRGSDSPRLDAEILLAHARECSRIELYTAFAELTDETQLAAFREMVRRRGEGMPVAQLVGYKEFYSLSLRVDENVLIPRPETEHLVVVALDYLKSLKPEDRPLRVADIGTGSGAIAIAIAKSLQPIEAKSLQPIEAKSLQPIEAKSLQPIEAKSLQPIEAKSLQPIEIVAVDCSPAALNIARWNVDKHDVGGSLTLLESDLFSAIDPSLEFDLICSNPPYVSEAEYGQLAATVRDFEPRTALLAGQQGTEVIERLLADAPSHLHRGGRMLIELSPMIADACAKLVESSDDWGEFEFIKDLQGHRRVMSVGRA